MKKVKLMLEYQCYPIWKYNGKGELIANELPNELIGDIEVESLLEEIQRTYNSLFIDNEIVFEYTGFSSSEEKQKFLQKINEALDFIKNRLGDGYVLESNIDI